MKTKLTQRKTATPPRDRVVFVLSGGGGRGAAQVGMLTELLAAGVRPDALVGTSVGALNATFLAADPCLDQARDLADRWTTLRSRDVFPGTAWSKVNHLLHRRAHLFAPAIWYAENGVEASPAIVGMRQSNAVRFASTPVRATYSV